MDDAKFYGCDALGNVNFQNTVIENIEKLGRVPGHTTVDSFGRSPVNSPHKGQWRGALMFSLIYV